MGLCLPWDFRQTLRSGERHYLRDPSGLKPALTGWPSLGKLPGARELVDLLIGVMSARISHLTQQRGLLVF